MYNANRALFCKGSIVKIEGYLKYREGSYTLNIQRIDNWQKSDTGNACEERFALLVLVDSLTDSTFEKMREILKAYPGNMDVYIKCDNKNYLHNQKVSKSCGLELELKALLGADNASILEKRR